MDKLLERFRRLMAATTAHNELHEINEEAVNHDGDRLGALTKNDSASVEPVTGARSFVKLQTVFISSDATYSSKSSLSSSNKATLEPHSIWRALYQSIPECLELIQKDQHLIAWLEYCTRSRCWVSTPPVSADHKSLAALVARFAAAEPDPLIVAIKSARGLHPEINPARQEVAQRARFSASSMTA